MVGTCSPKDWEVVYRPSASLRKIYIELTNRCNLNCSICYRQSWKENEGAIETDVFNRLVADISAFTELEEIVLGGLGEAMHHPLFWQLLEKISLSFTGKIILTSNGLALHAHEIPALAKFGVSRLVLSVDGANTQVQQQIRGEAAGETSRKLLALGRAVRQTPGLAWWWQLVWQKKNKDQLQDIIRLAAQYHVEKLVVTHLLPTSPKMVGETLFDPQISAQDLKHLERCRNLALLYGLSLQLPRHRPATERKCAFVESCSTVIGWDGRVAPCYRYLHGCSEYYYGRAKEIPSYAFGNLKENTLSAIWQSKDYLTFRYRIKNSLYPSCPDCEFVEGCDVVCRAEGDCDGGQPACGDCLWSRNMILCP